MHPAALSGGNGAAQSLAFEGEHRAATLGYLSAVLLGKEEAGEARFPRRQIAGVTKDAAPGGLMRHGAPRQAEQGGAFCGPQLRPVADGFSATRAD